MLLESVQAGRQLLGQRAKLAGETLVGCHLVSDVQLVLLLLSLLFHHLLTLHYETTNEVLFLH